MRKKERLFLVALFALAFFLLVPALVEGPREEAVPPAGKPFFVTLFSVAWLPEKQAAGQDAPARVNHPEGIVKPWVRGMAVPDVRVDANGHPLGESTYIKAVYQAFHLEDRSG